LAGTAAAIGNQRSFAVMHFVGGPLTEGRSDPIVSPGTYSGHVHTIFGSNAFSNNVTGAQLMTSTCTNAILQADKSAYWTPKLYFHDKAANTFEPVGISYMNVYYFFEASNDKIEAFPVGLQMLTGDASKKTPPATGNNILDPSQGTIQPVQITCPRSSYNPPSYPAGSDGTAAGIKDTNIDGAGAGFPFANCDGLYSPLRSDLHFPSCYDPSKSLTDFRNNMVFPTDAGNGKQDCPKGFKHFPHLFYEVYWDTPAFASRWTPNQGYQPFTFANGDGEGFSLHGDFIAAWDTTTLQHIIDTCNAGDAGMDQCQGAGAITPAGSICKIPNPTPETISGTLTNLPGNNPYFTWGVPASGGGSAAPIPPATLPDVEGYKYAGCWADTGNPRAITGIQFANPGGPISNTKCVSYCKSQGYSLAGTEYASQCFCGNKLDYKMQIDEASCNMACDGDKTQMCGGPNALSVYTTTGA
ncbi:WSC-domain-containing protein, partial [Thozetella sp. PMI_491]